MTEIKTYIIQKDLGPLGKLQRKIQSNASRRVFVKQLSKEWKIVGVENES